jgi:hypothetical protein
VSIPEYSDSTSFMHAMCGDLFIHSMCDEHLIHTMCDKLLIQTMGGDFLIHTMRIDFLNLLLVNVLALNSNLLSILYSPLFASCWFLFGFSGTRYSA